MRPSKRSDFVRVRPHHRYVRDPEDDRELEPVLPDDLVIERPPTRAELVDMVQVHHWELVAAAQRQVPIATRHASVIVQRILLDIGEGEHPACDDRHDALTWLRIEAIDRCMRFEHSSGRRLPALGTPRGETCATYDLIGRAARGDRRAIGGVFLLYTHTVLVDIERYVLAGCPRWVEGSTLTELYRALRDRRLRAPAVDEEPVAWLVGVMFGLAERRRDRLTARAERARSLASGWPVPARISPAQRRRKGALSRASTAIGPWHPGC
jgi:hypothetical protein